MSKYIDKPLFLLLSPLISLVLSFNFAFILLIICITIDFITGFKKYLFINGLKFKIFTPSTWVNFKSKGIRRSSAKAMEYFIFILIGAGLQFVFFPNFVYLIGDFQGNLPKTIILICVFTEIWSILENLEALNPRSRFLIIIRLSLLKINEKIKQWKEKE